MATSAIIGMQCGDGTYRTAYVGSDGYLAGVGAKLLIHYSDPEKITALINIGEMSPLCSTIEETMQDNYCDGGENHYPQDYASFEAMVETPDYLWRDGMWFYTPYDDSGMPLEYAPLTRAAVAACDTGMGSNVVWPEPPLV